jgi:uncharacterized protein (TIGR03086 family)
MLAAQAGAVRQFEGLTDDRCELATPCADWSVRALVVHLVEGSHMAQRMLDGASGEEARQVFGATYEDPVAECRERFAAEAAAFGRPGSFEMTVHHPRIGDIPGARFFGMRLTEYVLHTWDLARSLGGDEALPDELVEASWTALQPFASVIGEMGAFGTGPSGTVGDDAPLQLRLLDLSGRRP